MQLKHIGLDVSDELYLERLIHLCTENSSREQALRCKSSESELSWICDLGELCDRLTSWRNCFPKIQPLFSLSSYSKLSLVPLARNLGLGFLCSNKRDVQTAVEAGVCPQNIFFDNVTGLKANWKCAATHNAVVFVSDIKELKQFSSLSSRARFVVKIQQSKSDDSYRKMLAFAADKRMNIIGVACDVSDFELDIDFDLLIRRSVFLMHHAETLGHTMQVLHLGDSSVFSGELQKSQNMAEKLNAMLDGSVFPFWAHITVTADVSKALMQTSISVVATVTAVLADNQSHESGNSNVSTINDGVYGSFCGFMAGQQSTHCQPWALTERDCVAIAEDMVKCQVRGCAEGDLDIVAKSCDLPRDLQIGDKLVFDSMGHNTINCALDAIELNALVLPLIQFFILGDKITVAKELKCKEFKLCESHDVTSAEQRKISEAVLEVLIENMSLMEADVTMTRQPGGIFDASEVGAGGDYGMTIESDHAQYRSWNLPLSFL